MVRTKSKSKPWLPLPPEWYILCYGGKCISCQPGCRLTPLRCVIQLLWMVSNVSNTLNIGHVIIAQNTGFHFRAGRCWTSLNKQPSQRPNLKHHELQEQSCWLASVLVVSIAMLLLLLLPRRIQQTRQERVGAVAVIRHQIRGNVSPYPQFEINRACGGRHDSCCEVKGEYVTWYPSHRSLCG